MPAALGAAALLAHLACDEWRTAKARFLGAAALAFALVAASWPAALALRAPELTQVWWRRPASRGDFGENLGYYLGTASWFAWPAWPLAAWSAWALRAQWRTPRVFVPLAAALLVLPLICLGRSAAGHQHDAAGPAACAAGRARRGAAAARRGQLSLDWFGVTTFSVFSGVVWLGYVATMTGAPRKIAKFFTKNAPGFVPQFDFLQFAIALALTLAWLYLVFFAARSPTRGVTRWAAGVALLWGCFATLLLPWADHLKSYRAVALQIRAALPAGAGCIAGLELGAPQRAALSYHAGIRTEPAEAAAPSTAARGTAVPRCRFLIVQGKPREERAPGPGWSKLADVGRPGDRGERYRLYRYGPG